MKIAYHHEIYGIIYTLFLVLPTTLNSFVFANHSPTEREDTKNAPRPFSANNRLVGFVIQPKANLDRYESLLLVIDEYLSMCEGTAATFLCDYDG